MKKDNKHKRGFASLSKEKVRAIASLGGLAAQALGTAHRFTSEEARKAGAIGGRGVSKNREHMRKIGAKGGAAKKK